MSNNPDNPMSAQSSHSPMKPQSPARESGFSFELVSTPDIQKWMSATDQQLSEVCSISSEGKLNSEQKLKISNLCRKVQHNASQMAVIYQSLKQKIIEASGIIKELREKGNLSEHITVLKQTIEESCAGNASFADMVKKSNNIVRPNNLSAVAIYPQNKQRSSDETKTVVQTLIRPDQMKLHIRGVRKTTNGGVIISTETKDDAANLKQAVQMSLSGFTAGDPQKRKPRMIVVGVPASLSEKDFLTYIYEQNIADKIPSVSMASFLSSTKLSHKSGKKDASTCNFIIEVSAQIRKVLVAQGRLFINWTSCPVRDFTLVTRCYNCHQYGHAAKSCRDTTQTCGHCGEMGHSMTECVKKLDSPKCATCRRFNKPHGHKTGDAECPAKKAAEYRYINSVDYEGAYSAA